MIELRKKNNIARAVWMAGILVAVSARAVEREEVGWTNGDVRLSGTLYLPDGDGPHPGFIFLHGGGPETRGAFTMQRYARQFADHGIAMLLYDKRGAGESTGNRLESTYEDLAKDAVQGINLLVNHDDIDAKTIGIIGASEGGWTGPLTANMSDRDTLLILISAPPMSPLEQGLYEYEVELRGRGLSESDIAEAVALERQMARVQAADEGWEELDRAIESAKSRTWYEAAGSPARPDKTSAVYKWYRMVMNYNPIPSLKQLDVPVLLLYGANDVLVDAKRSAEIMGELAKSEDKDFTIHVYPNGQHNLTSNGFQFPEDHWDRIFNWIREKGDWKP